jgi:uncharacterized protein YceH (UPF0502 family)
MNSLVTGCNQKSNRDPVLDLSDLDVEEALAAVQKKCLAIKITGGRVERWRHNLYDAWQADKVELAIVAELLLRGPQTEGELRGRASRMEPIDDLEVLRGLLRRLAERRLVVYLTPEGRRGSMVTHGFHAPDELRHVREGHVHEEAVSVPQRVTGAAATTDLPSDSAGATSAFSTLEKRLSALETEVADLRKTIREILATVGDLKDRIHASKEGMGA